jgi:transcriptional regulator with XRE-family HTH domain
MSDLQERRIGFSSRLRSLITARGLPLVPGQLADESSLATAQTFSNWLNGVQLPRRGAVLELAKWLHTTDDFLLNGVSVLHFKAEPPGQFTEEAAQLLRQFDQLDAYGKRVVKAMLTSMVNLKANHP